MLGESAVDGGRVGEGGGRHCHRRPGEEDGEERRVRTDPVATDGARQRGADDRWDSRGETATSGACAGNPSHRREGENMREAPHAGDSEDGGWLITSRLAGLGCRIAGLISPVPASPASPGWPGSAG